MYKCEYDTTGPSFEMGPEFGFRLNTCNLQTELCTVAQRSRALSGEVMTRVSSQPKIDASVYKDSSDVAFASPMNSLK